MVPEHQARYTSPSNMSRTIDLNKNKNLQCIFKKVQLFLLKWAVFTVANPPGLAWSLQEIKINL